jgi:propanol-preferring alcohol dehydrogenase
MRAMVLRTFGFPDAKGPLVLTDVPRPEVGAGDILIRVSCCGVCHTDLHTVIGELPDVILPRIPGHEVVGVVEEAGKDVRHFQEGQRVGAAWLHSACGVCRFCRRGDENLCERALFNGFHVDGGYAEFMKVPEAFAYALPEVFTDEEAAPLLCAGIIGYRALRLSQVKPGGTLGLFGFGASAHIAIQVARKWDCRVFVFTRSEDHRALARRLGAEWVGAAQEDPPAKVEGAIIFAPVGALFLDALRVLDRGGTAASAGIHMSPIPEIDYDYLLYHERTMRSVANATRRDGEELLRVAAEIPVRTTTQAFPLEKANEALALLKAGRVNGAAVLRIGP